MLESIIETLSNLSSVQLLILLVSSLMVILGGIKIISKSLSLLIWFIIAVLGAGGVMYALNPEMFADQLDALQNKKLDIPSINLKDFVKP